MRKIEMYRPDQAAWKQLAKTCGTDLDAAVGYLVNYGGDAYEAVNVIFNDVQSDRPEILAVYYDDQGVRRFVLNAIFHPAESMFTFHS